MFSRSKLSTRDGPLYESSSRVKLESVFEEVSPGTPFRSSAYLGKSFGDLGEVGWEEDSDDSEDDFIPDTIRCAPENVQLNPGEDINPLIEIPDTSFFPTGPCLTYADGFSGLMHVPETEEAQEARLEK